VLRIRIRAREAPCGQDLNPLQGRREQVDNFSVALVGPYPPPCGGVSVHIKRLHRRLAALNISSLVYCQCMSKPAPEDNVIPASKYAWHRWILEHGWRCNASIVHFHDGWFWAPAALAMLLRGKRVVMTFHNQQTGGVMWRQVSSLQRLVSRWLLRHPRVWWVAVSPEVSRQLIALGVPPARISVAPAYIPHRADADASSLPAYALDFLGTHSPVLSTYAWKLTIDAQGVDVYGFDHCLEMIKSLKADFPKIGLGVSLPQIFDVGYFRDLKARITAYGIEDNVLFITEPLNDAQLLWQASDVFVRATNTDGDAVAVREALALRVPVVASDASARPDGVVLFETRNLEAMNNAVRQVLTHHAAHVQALQSISIDDNFPPLLKLYRAIASSMINPR
jgi:glycosyltransferase involved in cell wall biosynthesis